MTSGRNDIGEIVRDILEICVELDSLAATTYSAMSEHCSDPELAEVFEQLAIEENSHVGWWLELLEAWSQGLVPDVVTHPDTLVRSLEQVREDVHASLPEDISTLTPAQMIELATQLEFFMLDSVFSDLIELAEPGRTGHHRDAYTQHITKLVKAIGQAGESDTLARFLSRVLERALRDNVTLSRHATRDTLTGLFNRRGILAHLEQWVSWAHRYEHPLALLLVDVDSFKKINDSYGHPVGDEVLTKVAEALRSSTRDSDLVARYGGDEFAVVAPETKAEDYQAFVDRIMESVRDIDCRDEHGVRVLLSVSIGGAVLIPHEEPESAQKTIDSLFAAADTSLYEAKKHGRDRAGEPAIVE